MTRQVETSFKGVQSCGKNCIIPFSDHINVNPFYPNAWTANLSEMFCSKKSLLWYFQKPSVTILWHVPAQINNLSVLRVKVDKGQGLRSGIVPSTSCVLPVNEEWDESLKCFNKKQRYKFFRWEFGGCK